MEITLSELADLLVERGSQAHRLTEPTSSPLVPLVGRDVIVRTVTMIYTGHLTSFDGSVLELSDAAWIADTGRWADALSSGKLSEVEPYPGTAYVNWSCVVDLCVWAHPLPREQK